MPHEDMLALSEEAIKRLALERLHPFIGKQVRKGAIDACASFLAAEGTLRVPSLIVRCTIRHREFSINVIVDKAISQWRLSECFVPFLSKVLSRFRGQADFLVLLSDNLYPNEEALPELAEHFVRVPFLRCDWNESNPDSHQAILIPDFHLQQASYSELFAKIKETQDQYPFEDRENKIFWRGSLSGPGYVTQGNLHTFPRYHLLRIARSVPEVIDAHLTNYDDIAARDHDGVLRAHLQQHFGGLAPYIPEPEFVTYKYLISLDGAVAAWRRVPTILASGSVLLLQHEWNQFFYPGLLPWIHYVPLRKDIADLLERYDWLEGHPAQAKAIASAGHAFAMRFLTPEAIEAHFFDILLRLAGGAQTSEPSHCIR
jgi:glycosyl transferase family 90